MSGRLEDYRKMRQMFVAGISGGLAQWRRPMGILIYLHQALFSLPPLFLLFRVNGTAWYIVAVKALAAVWLALALITHLLLPMQSDRIHGLLYRRNRAMYVFIMASVALMLWNPGRFVFFFSLAAFLFFSACYILVMQVVSVLPEARSDGN